MTLAQVKSYARPMSLVTVDAPLGAPGGAGLAMLVDTHQTTDAKPDVDVRNPATTIHRDRGDPWP